MDLNLLYVYGLIILIGICLFIIAGILGLFIIKIVNIKREKSREYLKNIIYGIVGGIIAVVLLEIRGDGYKSFNFYITTLPLSLITIFVFILIGFGYLFLIDKLFTFLENLEKVKKSGKSYKEEGLNNVMNKKIRFAIWVICLALAGASLSWILANKFSLIADEKYIEIIVTTAVFLAGFGLIAMDKQNSSKKSFWLVFFPNFKSIILWSIASIIFSFCYLIFQASNFGKMFFSLSVGFLFFTITLIVLLVLYHDNKYLKEIET